MPGFFAMGEWSNAVSRERISSMNASKAPRAIPFAGAEMVKGTKVQIGAR
jgi:hypothetical protein